MTIAHLEPVHVRTLSVACCLQAAYGPGADPSDLRVARMIGRRFLRHGSAASMADHEWTAVQRAAAALEATERASLEGQTARRSARYGDPAAALAEAESRRELSAGSAR